MSEVHPGGAVAIEVIARQVRDACKDERDWIDHHEAEEDGEAEIAWHRGALQALEETLDLIETGTQSFRLAQTGARAENGLSRSFYLIKRQQAPTRLRP